MAITSDPIKRKATLADRGLDFHDADKVFADPNEVTAADLRSNYGEPRFITAGLLDGRMVVVVWTPRGADRHVFSMRYCHGKEIRKIKTRRGRFQNPLR